MKKLLLNLEEGILLAKKSPLLWLIFVLPTFLTNLLPTLNVYTILRVTITLCLSLFQIAYIFSLPLLLESLQSKIDIDSKSALITMIRMGRRLKIHLVIIFFILFSILSVTLSTTPALINPPTYPPQSLTSPITPLKPTFLSIGITFLFTFLFSFLPIFYALEKRDIWDSLQKSISFSLKHIQYVILVTLIHTVLSLTTAQFINVLWLRILYILLLSSVSYILVCTSLVYYQFNKTKND